MLELLVVVVDDTDPICLAVCEVAGQIAAHSGPQQRGDAPGGWQMVLVDVIQYLQVYS